VQVMIDRDGDPHHRRCGYLFDVTFRYSTHQRSFAGARQGRPGRVRIVLLAYTRNGDNMVVIILMTWLCEDDRGRWIKTLRVRREKWDRKL
jgi:hypothetical protein